MPLLGLTNVTREILLYDTTAASLDFTLPTAEESIGRILTVKKKDATANTITVMASGAETIDGGGNYIIAGQREETSFISDGENWWIIGESTAGGAAGGDVTGPGASTDNALTRFDGATGKLLQNSGVLLDDSNNITGVNDLTIDNDGFIDGDLEFSREVDHVIRIDDSTTAATAGGDLDIQGAAGATTGAGGDISVTTGNGGTTSGAGGLLSLIGGDAQAGNSLGGRVFVEGGSGTGSSAGGQIELLSGAGQDAGAAVSGNSGIITITTPAGATATTGTAGIGGNISLTGGDGGDTTGAGGIAGDGADLNFVSGTGGDDTEGGSGLGGDGGDINFTAGAAGVGNTPGLAGSINFNSNFQLNDSLTLSTQSTAISANTDGSAIVFVTDTSAPRTITLATDQVVVGRVITVKDTDGNAGTNNITIDTQGAETIDGVASILVTVNHGVARFISDGTNWFTL